MTTTDVRAAILRALGGVAPEADLEHLQPDIGFREQLDIDSMDYLNFLIALHKEFHVEIPEKDYPKLSTLQGCVAYLRSLQDVQARK
jgi:acyl carrier protein